MKPDMDRVGTERICKLTKRVVDGAVPAAARFVIWDVELKGFGVRVESSGTKTYLVRYRPKGMGRSAARRFVTIGRHGPLTADEARKQAQGILGQVAVGGDPAADIAKAKDGKTFAELTTQFLRDHVEAKRRPSTVKSYSDLLLKQAVPKLGNRKADTLTRSDIAKLHLGMSSTPANANRMVAIISSLYSFAGRHGLVAEGFNPARGIDKYREEGRERYLTAKELERLGETLREAETIGLLWKVDENHPKAKHIPKPERGRRDLLDEHAVAAVRLLLFTGARLREILHLRWDEVDVERGMLFLPTSKTGRKTIVLNAVALDILAALRAKQTGSPYVIVGRSLDHPRTDLKKPWDAIRRCAQLAGVRLHDLRHTFASIGAGSSLGLPIVGKLLGHSQPQTTARYAHLDADPLRVASNIIGEKLKGAMQRPAAQNTPQDRD